MSQWCATRAPWKFHMQLVGQKTVGWIRVTALLLVSSRHRLPVTIHSWWCSQESQLLLRRPLFAYWDTLCFFETLLHFFFLARFLFLRVLCQNFFHLFVPRLCGRLFLLGPRHYRRLPGLEFLWITLRLGLQFSCCLSWNFFPALLLVRDLTQSRTSQQSPDSDGRINSGDVVPPAVLLPRLVGQRCNFQCSLNADWNLERRRCPHSPATMRKGK